jgi:hypothetical protein
MTKHRFPIGTQYTSRNGKVSRVCTVSDQLTVTNSKGEVVRLYYHATHEFMGQKLTDHDVGDTTIARNLFNARIEDFA